MNYHQQFQQIKTINPYDYKHVISQDTLKPIHHQSDQPSYKNKSIRIIPNYQSVPNSNRMMQQFSNNNNDLQFKQTVQHPQFIQLNFPQRQNQQIEYYNNNQKINRNEILHQKIKIQEVNMNHPIRNRADIQQVQQENIQLTRNTVSRRTKIKFVKSNLELPQFQKNDFASYKVRTTQNNNDFANNQLNHYLSENVLPQNQVQQNENVQQQKIKISPRIIHVNNIKQQLPNEEIRQNTKNQETKPKASLFSTDQMTDTLLATQTYNCYNCKLPLKNGMIQLQCFHSYHQECFQQCISSQQNQTKLQCFCKQFIKLHLIRSIDPTLHENILKNQLEVIYKNNSGLFQKCQACLFFYIKDQKRNIGKAYCDCQQQKK